MEKHIVLCHYFSMNEFDVSILSVTTDRKDNVFISVFDVPGITPEIRVLLDAYITNICAGAQNIDLEDVKLKLKNRCANWSVAQKEGAIAEFFIHLYMQLFGYKQNFLFFNLEEGSLKKGFDGVYSFRDKYWLMESKSGNIDSVGISHAKKAKEAFCDLKRKITSDVSNNPWDNAYNHASHRDVGGEDRLLNNLQSMAKDFERGVYQNIDEMNIVPCATIFLNGLWNPRNHDEIIESIKAIDDFEGKEVHVVCVSQHSIGVFFEYLESE